MHRRARDLGGAARAGYDRKTEAVQLDDRSDQAQAKAEPAGAPALVGAVEALGYRFVLGLGDARTGVLHTDDGLAFASAQGELHPSALGGELHGVVDQIGDGLEKEIAVAVNASVVHRLDLKGDTFVLGDRFIEIAHLLQQRSEPHAAESVEPAAMLDLCNAQ